MCFSYECNDVSIVDVVKARKPRTCSGCNRGIAKGDTYRRHKGIFDGRWYLTDECEACHYLACLIYAQEVSEGCQRHEAWVAVEEAQDHAAELGWWIPGVFGEPPGEDDEEHQYSNVVRFGSWREAVSP